MGLKRETVECKWAEEEIRKSEEKCRIVVENANEGIVVVQDGMLKFFNPKVMELTHYSQEELSSKPFAELLHPDDREMAIGHHLKRLNREEIPHLFPFRIIDKYGNIRHLEISGVLISWEGRPATLNFISDITERKRMEKELRELIEALVTLVTNAPIGLSLIATDGTYEYVNSKFVEMFGYTLQDVSTGKKWFEKAYPDPEYRQKVIACWIEDLRKGKMSETRPRTFTVTCKDGSKKEIFFRPATLTDGRQLVTYEDITERKRAEQRLREYEARYTHLLDHLPDGVALTRRGRIIRVNPLMAQMFGYPLPKKMRGLFFWDLAPPGSKEIVRQHSTPRSLGPQGRNRFEFQALRKDGSMFPAECTLTVDRIEAPPFVLAIIRDVTERKTYEEQRKLLSERIMTVQERERASIARELHDELGQALTGIKMDMAWIKSHIKGADETVSDRFEALGNLVDTTIESVREMATSLRPSVLDRLGLSAAIEWYAGEFERRTGIECITESESVDFNINSNVAINVYRIFQEALTNIARHAGASRVEVRITQDRGCFTISISDNGRGIPSQGVSGRMSLGIAGMRERAELIKGGLDIQSRKGKGTKVTLYLPTSL